MKKWLAAGLVVAASLVAIPTYAATLQQGAAKACKGVSPDAADNCAKNYVKEGEKACKNLSADATDRCITDFVNKHGGPIKTGPKSGGRTPVSGSTPTSGSCGDNCRLESADSLGIPQVYLQGGAQTIIGIISFLAGVLSVVFIIIGGFRYITSSGNAQKVESAKQTLLYAIVGLILSLLAPALAGFIISKA